MIIKVEGLPQGQKIKHINVDIQFEDDVAIVKTKTEPSVKSVEDKDSNIEFDRPVHPGASDSDETREQKDIPKEMTDVEF